MDHFEGVVLDYLRADRALFVNSQCCIQLNEGANPDTSGPCWHCDAVVVSFKEQAACLCEITYADGRRPPFGTSEAVGRTLAGGQGSAGPGQRRAAGLECNSLALCP